MTARPARVVGVEVASVAWAAALIAVGLGPALVIAEGEAPTQNITLHSPYGIGSAGNDGRKSYESPFRGSGQFIDLGVGREELHDFDAGPGVDLCQQITLPAGQGLALIFQWDQPFFSVSGVPGSNSDLDILLTDAACYHHCQS